MSVDLRLVRPTAPPEADGLMRPSVMLIRTWARERLLDAGPASLSAELFALFLRTGVSGSTAIDVARQLLRRFGSLRGVLDASAAELREERGIGPARAATLLAVSELCRRALAEKTRDREVLNAPGVVEDYLRLLISTKPSRCSSAYIWTPAISCCTPRNRRAARSRGSRSIRGKSCVGRSRSTRRG